MEKRMRDIVTMNLECIPNADGTWFVNAERFENGKRVALGEGEDKQLDHAKGIALENAAEHFYALAREEDPVRRKREAADAMAKACDDLDEVIDSSAGLNEMASKMGNDLPFADFPKVWKWVGERLPDKCSEGQSVHDRIKLAIVHLNINSLEVLKKEAGVDK